MKTGDIKEQFDQASYKLEFLGDLFEKLGSQISYETSGDALKGLSLIIWGIQSNVHYAEICLNKGRRSVDIAKDLKKNEEELKAALNE